MFTGGPNDKVGMATCTAEAMQAMSANFFYYVKGKLALVLDRQSVGEGQVVGVLLHGDVVITTHITGAWVMLPEGSYVRHPQMRTGRVKTKRDGWLIVEHGDYGMLLGATSHDQVKNWFDNEAFLKVALIKPIVKAGAKARAKGVAKAKAKADASEEPPDARGTAAKPSTEAPAGRRPGPEEVPVDSTAAGPEAAGEPAAATEKAEAAAKAPSPVAVPLLLPPPGSNDAVATASPALASPPKSAAGLNADPLSMRRPSSATVVPPPPVPKSLASAVPAAAAAGALAKAPGTRAGAKAKGPPAAAVKERLKPESFEEHIATCTSEHWKISRRYVWVRDDPSPTGATVSVLREGALLCQGIRVGVSLYSADAKCLRLNQDSKFWSTPEAFRPEHVITKPEIEIAFIQVEHPQVGALVDFISPPSKMGSGALVGGESPSERPEMRRMHAPILSSRSADFSETDHWVVAQWGAWIHSECDVSGPVEFKMQPQDVLVLGPQPLRIRHEKGHWWLHVQEGAQVYRRTEDSMLEMLGQGGLKVHGYVLSEDTLRTYIKHVPPEAPGMTVKVLSGFGEPWMVCQDHLPVYKEKDLQAETFGALPRGSIVGLRRMDENWCELELSSDLRLEVDAGNGSALVMLGLNEATGVAMQESKGPVKERRFSATMSVPSEFRRAWVPRMTSYGTELLERCRGDLEEGCIVTEERRKLYREVIRLCHSRIYEENVNSLWEGETSKLPSRKSLEAKLFDRSTYVLHAARGNTLAGGAIIKECKVSAMASASTTGTLGVGKDAGELEGYPGRTFVGYIDSCASIPGSHGGSAIWEVVTKMDFVMVACHPILLQSTVDFWQARGMKRYEVDVHKDREEFRNSLLVLPQGKVTCELEDLVDALPPSHLPLFVWLSAQCAEIQDDIDGASRIFVPDDPDNYF